MLYGQAEPSGLVNIVSKRPQFEARHQADIQLGNYDRQQVRFDTTGALDADNTLAYRLTGLYRDSDSPVKGGHDDRTYIAPAFTWQPNEKTTLTVLTHYQKDTTVGNSSYFNDTNGRVVRSLPSGDPAFQDFTQEQYQIGYLFEHLLNEHWTLRQNVRTGRVDADARYTQIDSVSGNIASRSTGGWSSACILMPLITRHSGKAIPAVCSIRSCLAWIGPSLSTTARWGLVQHLILM